MATVRAPCTCLVSPSLPLRTGSTAGKRRALPRGQLGRVRMARTFEFTPIRSVRGALLVALTSQVAAISREAVQSAAAEVAKYVNNTRRSDARNLEEALMTVPDLETIPYKVIRREKFYEIRDVESYLVAETDLPGRSAFDFFGSGKGFNTLADYLFGKNVKKEAMEMTTPVVVQKGDSQGEKMEMTTPVLSQKDTDRDPWRMAFVIPSKYTEDDVPTPENSAVKIRRVPSKTVAVTAFSGFVTDVIVKQKEMRLRRALSQELDVRVSFGAQPEVAQFNPPFTPPFARRNEVALEVELSPKY